MCSPELLRQKGYGPLDALPYGIHPPAAAQSQQHCHRVRDRPEREQHAEGGLPHILRLELGFRVIEPDQELATARLHRLDGDAGRFQGGPDLSLGTRIHLGATGAGHFNRRVLIKGVGQGFADKIELLIGLDAAAERLTGVFVLDQKETPGLGDNIRSREFTSRFEDKPVDTGVFIVKAGKGSGPDGQPGQREVESWSGATVSSLAVSGIINAAVADFRTWLAQREQDS